MNYHDNMRDDKLNVLRRNRRGNIRGFLGFLVVVSIVVAFDYYINVGF